MSHVFTHQKTRHIRALGITGRNRHAYGHRFSLRTGQKKLLHQRSHLAGVEKNSIALPQTNRAILYRKKLSLLNQTVVFGIIQRHRRGVVACIQSQKISHFYASSLSWLRAKAPSTPLTKGASSSPPYFLANSTASLIETLTGTSSFF